MIKIHKKFSSNKKIITLVVLAAVVIYAILAATLHLWPLQKKVFITATNVKTSLPSNQTHTGSKSSGAASSSAQSNSPKSPSQVDPDTKTLAEPSGTFVNLYDASADTQMSSICNTTVGATCQVIFSKGNLSIALPARTVDSSGAASWAWTPGQIGLTSGHWHVTAKAALGSQTKTTDNGSLELVIQ
jgi:hypothetical protein